MHSVITAPARLEQISAIHSVLDGFWRQVEQSLTEPPDPSWRARFSTAVAEIAANIVRHAHPAGVEPGRMQLRLRAYRDRIEAQFHDRGIAFRGLAETQALEALEPPELLDIPEGGYGLGLVRLAVDEVRYDRTESGQNRWRLVKRLPVHD